MPQRVLDLFTEFRDRTNGLELLAGNGLVGALTHFGLDAIDAQEKDDMRLRILRGPPWLENEPNEILDYCATDTNALERLLPAMLPRIDLPRALLRGRYMCAAAATEWNGVPIDTETLELLREHWTDIQEDLIAAVDADFNVYDGRTFKLDKFEAYLARSRIPWPRLKSGQLALDDETFEEMSKVYPATAPLRELRSSLSKMRLNTLAVGSDGRNRTMLSAFRASSGRNQPKTSRFIFGPSKWLRGLIKPPPGHAVAYIDWAAQENGIAAKLSNDELMMAAYQTGDPYIAFGKLCGRLPRNATPDTHPELIRDTRSMLKECVLGISYGMWAKTLAFKIGQPEIVARDLLRSHRETFKVFWRWSDAALDHAMFHGSLQTVFGWHLHVTAKTKPRTLQNFPMQANGAEMMRIACCLATERGIEVCAPIHDAILICSPIDRIDNDVAEMRAAMDDASRAVLDGFVIRTEAKIVRYPNRYMDERGAAMWDQVMGLIAKRQQQREVA